MMALVHLDEDQPALVLFDVEEKNEDAVDAIDGDNEYKVMQLTQEKLVMQSEMAVLGEEASIDCDEQQLLLRPSLSE